MAVRKRRRQAEIEELVAEFAASGLERGDFCRSRGLALSTLSRHLKKQRRKMDPARVGGRLVPVELATRKPAGGYESTSPLVVVLSDRCKIEVQRGFDDQTLERLIHLLEKA